MVCSNSAVREGMTKESAVNTKRSGDDHTDAKKLLWCQTVSYTHLTLPTTPYV